MFNVIIKNNLLVVGCGEVFALFEGTMISSFMDLLGSLLSFVSPALYPELSFCIGPVS